MADLANVYTNYENERKDLCVKYARNVHAKLKDLINASIYCKVVNDILMVSIRTDNKSWDYPIPNVLARVMDGEDEYVAVDEIYSAFKHYILNQYFYGKEKPHGKRIS